METAVISLFHHYMDAQNVSLSFNSLQPKIDSQAQLQNVMTDYYAEVTMLAVWLPIIHC